MHLHFLHFVFPMYFIIEDLKKKKKKSKNLVSSRSREPSLVSRLVSWDKCLVTPLVFTIITTFKFAFLKFHYNFEVLIILLWFC